MSDRSTEQVGTSSRQTSRERVGVLALGLSIVGAIVVYAILNSRSAPDSSRNLLPYQVLAQTLPDADQQVFRAIRQGLLAAESDRARSAAWPSPETLAARGVAPFDAMGSGPRYKWSRLEQASIINYFGQPDDGSAPAWLIEIQEPEPGMPPDTAPPDDEHHRLPDGTMLHTYVWMHRYGGQVTVGFVRQPQTVGWTAVFATAPNPVYYNRR